MLLKIKTPYLIKLAIFFCFPLSSYAINISAFRIYLDNDMPTTSFTVYNPDVEHQSCSLKLTHYAFDANSEITHLDEGQLPANSASPWIRFSPKEFNLTPANSQTIRFTIRKKANTEDAEYRSYLLVDCEAVSSIGDKERLISLKPKLLHNVPIVVRTGKLDANISISNISAESGSLKFSVERTGKRSIYGDAEIIHKDTGELIVAHRGFSIYPESERYFFELNIKDYSPKDLKIRILENPNYGGNLSLEADVVSD